MKLGLIFAAFVTENRKRKLKSSSPVWTEMAHSCLTLPSHLVALSGVESDFAAKLACSGCGRWVEANKSFPSTSRPAASSDALNEESSTKSGGVDRYEELGMESEVKKRPLAPLANFSYCVSCRGLVCSLCVSTHLDAMACPQCLSLHPVSSSNESSLSLNTSLRGQNSQYSSSSLFLSSVFSNRCKKCSSCPSCDSPALGLRSLSIKDAPESLKRIFFPNVSVMPNVSPTSAPSISFFHCSFCRWSSLDAAFTAPSVAVGASSALPQIPGDLSASNQQQQHSNLLYADSTAKLISKTLSIERQSSNTSHFAALVEQRREILHSAHSSAQAPTSALSPISTQSSAASLQFTLSNMSLNPSNKPPTPIINVDETSTPPPATSQHGSSMSTSQFTSPLLSLVSQQRVAVQDALNHPGLKYPSRRAQSSPSEHVSKEITLTEEEKAQLQVEFEHLDAAWKSNLENPTHFFKPAPREPVSPLHLSSAAKTMFVNKISPIARISTGKSTEEKHTTEKDSSRSVSHPERIPLFPICSKKCMKCERLLVKPTTDGATLATHSNLGESFASLPEFKRRHTALSFTPMIDVIAANGFEDYRPSLDWDNWNLISLTITNPPLLPAIQITLSSDYIAPTDDEEKGEDAANDDQARKASAVAAADPHSICQVDCNGCETWILEDEPINLDDGYEDEPEKPAWLSHPGVPSHLQLLEADTDNPAISSRKSRSVTMVLLVMPELKKYESLKKSTAESASADKDASSSSQPIIYADLNIKVSWPSPTDENPNLRHELNSPFRINLSKIFEVLE